MANSCLDCKYARWEMTKHDPPRINPRQPGRCTYHVGPLLVPKSVDANALESLVNPFRGRPAIWADAPHVDCPTWERREA